MKKCGAKTTKKYELTEEKKNIYGKTLHRIKALRSFADVEEGDLGGWIAREDNLSQEGDCWVYDEACVYEDARVYGNARVSENAIVNWFAHVYANAHVYGNAHLFQNPHVYGNARVGGSALISGYPLISGNAQVNENARVSGNAHVSENVILRGGACICGEALVYGQAEVSGGAWIRGNAQVYGKAKIECEEDIVWFSHVGSENETLTAYKTKDGAIEATRGSFRGSIEKFKKEIKKTHGDNAFAKEYELLVAVIELRFKSA